MNFLNSDKWLSAIILRIFFPLLITFNFVKQTIFKTFIIDIIILEDYCKQFLISHVVTSIISF